ncbi:MAG: hypothetical protein Ct9H90mP25_4340 [Gammaproteobacteria bacterium]|nr:MAG: hypothetical protein Ct9H90mP25_4340 [Gammaproteobacteria bacterium]
MRTSFIRNLSRNQGIELGAEGAQTIRDSDLRMGLNTPGEPNPNYGNLVPVSIDNSKSTVQELRYEPFTIHNWQINDRMSLESDYSMRLPQSNKKGTSAEREVFPFQTKDRLQI